MLICVTQVGPWGSQIREDVNEGGTRMLKGLKHSDGMLGESNVKRNRMLVGVQCLEGSNLAKELNVIKDSNIANNSNVAKD